MAEAGPAFFASFKYCDVEKNFALYNGISATDVVETLRAAFHIAEEITSLANETTGETYQLSMFESDPDYLAQQFRAGGTFAVRSLPW